MRTVLGLMSALGIALCCLMSTGISGCEDAVPSSNVPGADAVQLSDLAPDSTTANDAETSDGLEPRDQSQDTPAPGDTGDPTSERPRDGDPWEVTDSGEPQDTAVDLVGDGQPGDPSDRPDLPEDGPGQDKDTGPSDPSPEDTPEDQETQPDDGFEPEEDPSDGLQDDQPDDGFEPEEDPSDGMQDDQPDDGCEPEEDPSDGMQDDQPDSQQLTCPDECMVLVDNRFCMDRYEASRPDATAGNQGSSIEYAACVEGVVPWWSSGLTGEECALACQAAGKRLCTGEEFLFACSNGNTTVYPYGDDYDPLICNGIDTFCRCGPGEACDGIEPCPYAHCYNQDPDGIPGGCGSNWHVWPTGSTIEGSSACATALGIRDMSGNLWEATLEEGGTYVFRAGACNCIDSEWLHECDEFRSGTQVNRKGFRCCDDPE